MSDDPTLRFDRFEIRPHERKLLIEGRAAPLGARAFDVLLAFAERPGRVLAKNELLDIVWPNVVVEENNLQVQISTLRKLLGASVIATVPGRGYAFTATAVAEAPPAAALTSVTSVASVTSATPYAAVAATPGTAPPAPAAPLLRTNLPERLPMLIGREDDLAALEALLHDRALVTVVGPGGIGKTLLAQHLLDGQRARHAHGVCFVELASLADPRRVAGTVATALGIQIGAGDGDALNALVQAVAPLSLLLALDNAEHLLDEVARVARALHAGAPKLTLVVTSQAPLQLDAEHVYRVGTLALPEDGVPLTPQAAQGYGAVALFAERARRVDRHFALDDGNVATTVALCRRLDGLPLAIGLAAARVPLLGIEGLAAALGERLKLLTSGTRDAAARHRTLRAALEWSHSLLDPREQVVFRRLAVVVGSASLDLVRGIAADDTLDEWSALDALSVLVDRSLVVLIAGADDAEPRYRLLESPRAYAQEQLAAAGEEAAVRAQHAAVVASRWALAMEQFEEGRHGRDAWLRMVEPDLGNARAALAWGLDHDAAAAVAVAGGLVNALLIDAAGGRTVCDAVEPLLADERVPARLRARLGAYGARALPIGRGIEWAQRAVVLYRSIDDATGRFYALCSLAWTSGLIGDAQSAAAAVAEMDGALGTSPYALAEGEQARAGLAIAQQRWDDVLSHLRRSADFRAETGNTDPLPRINVIEAQILAGHVDDALRDGERLLAQLQGTRLASRVAWTQILLVAAWLAKDEVAPARALVAAAWPDGPMDRVTEVLASHAVLLAALEGRPRAAAQLLGYADAQYATQGESRQDIESLSVERALAIVRPALGEAEVARMVAAGASLGNDAARQVALGKTDLPG